MAKAKVMNPWYLVLDSAGYPTEAMNSTVFYDLEVAKCAVLDDYGDVTGFSIVEVRPVIVYTPPSQEWTERSV